MKISLVSPSSVMYRKSKGIFPQALRYAPLTLTTLAGLVPPEFNADIEIFDEGVSVVDYKNLEADLVGISCITGTANRAYKIADYLKDKGIPVVIGGVHPTLLPEEAAQHADSVVTGLAFDTWPQLLQDFLSGKMKKFYKQPPKPDLSNFPTPRRDLLKKFSYITKNSIEATFGCPYDCDFCAVVTTQKEYIHRPIPEVIKELEQLKGNFVTFVDPSPIENKEYIKALYKAMIPLKKNWGGLATVRITEDDELLNLAAESGCKGLLIGFETVTQEGITDINKGFNKIQNYKEVVKKLHDKGIVINGTFMFGMDSHDKDIFEKTVDFVNEVGIDLPRYAIYTPFPGTKIFKRLKKEKRIITENWSLYDVQHVVFKPNKMSAEELIEGHWDAWEKTYSLSSILRRLKKSMCNPLLAGITNLGYSYYAKRLKNFPNSFMESEEKKWVSKSGLEQKVQKNIRK